MNGPTRGRPRIKATLGMMMDSHPSNAAAAAVPAATEVSEAMVSCPARAELKVAL